jgi:hypothetical protein
MTATCTQHLAPYMPTQLLLLPLLLLLLPLLLASQGAKMPPTSTAAFAAAG